MTFRSAGVAPLLTTARTLNKKEMATYVGTVRDIIVGCMALMAGADHIRCNPFASPPIKGEVLAHKV